jgi:hypothetical protein
MKKLGIGLEHLAKYVASDQFQKDLKTFGEDISVLAHKIASALKWLGLIPDHDAKPKPTMGFWQGVGTLLNPFNLSPSDNADATRAVSKGLSGAWHWAWGDDATLSPAQQARRDRHRTGESQLNSEHPKAAAYGAGQFSSLEDRYGLPRGLLLNTYGAESAYGARPGTSSAGARGPFQFMPDTAKQYGVDNRDDLKQSSEGAAKYFRNLLREFHGDVAKAVAAYNWGEGHLERAIKKYGSDWANHIPAETRDYLDKVLNGNRLAHGVAIRIDNNTGANTIVTASQIAQ